MKSLSLGTALTLSLAVPPKASAEITVHTGFECRYTKAHYDSAGSDLRYETFGSLGIVNFGAEIEWVVCPLPFRSTSPIKPQMEFLPVIGDRPIIVNTVDNSPTDHVMCSINAQTGTTKWFGSGGQSCGFLGLCDTDNPGYVTPPHYNGVDAVLVPGIPRQEYVSLFLTCRIPASTTAPNAGASTKSAVTSYRMFYDPDG